jgi:hypothetical protein
MADLTQLAEWRKYRRQSLHALPGHAVFLSALVLVLLALEWWFGLPLWVWLLALGSGAWGLVGDCINIIYLNRCITAGERDGP